MRYVIVTLFLVAVAHLAMGVYSDSAAQVQKASQARAAADRAALDEAATVRFVQAIPQ